MFNSSNYSQQQLPHPADSDQNPLAPGVLTIPSFATGPNFSPGLNFSSGPHFPSGQPFHNIQSYHPYHMYPKPAPTGDPATKSDTLAPNDIAKLSDKNSIALLPQQYHYAPQNHESYELGQTTPGLAYNIQHTQMHAQMSQQSQQGQLSSQMSSQLHSQTLQNNPSMQGNPSMQSMGVQKLQATLPSLAMQPQNTGPGGSLGTSLGLQLASHNLLLQAQNSIAQNHPHPGSQSYGLAQNLSGGALQPNYQLLSHNSQDQLLRKQSALQVHLLTGGKFSESDVELLRQLFVVGERHKWKQITKEINVRSAARRGEDVVADDDQGLLLAKNVSPTYVIKQYQNLLGLPKNLVYFGVLGLSLPYVVAEKGWDDLVDTQPLSTPD